VPELLARKVYGDTRPKYGLELVDKISDECLQYNSPVLFSATDEALVAQIIKCKGRFDVQYISCFKELLGLMAKDRDVAAFVWNLPPYNYQSARFTDWFRPYLQEQLAEQTRMAVGTSPHFKNKIDLLNKAVAHLDALEPLFKELEDKQMERMAKCLAEGGSGEFTDVAEHWIGASSKEVIKHFPPQLVIGRPVAVEKEIFVQDTDPRVKVQIFEVEHEYAYSAPTGLFNLAAPHIARRTNQYSIETYYQHVKSNEKQRAAQDNADLEDLSEQQQMSQEDRPEAQTAASTAVEEFTTDARDFLSSKRTGPVLMRVILVNKSETEDVKVWYRLATKNAAGANVSLPHSSRKAYLSAKNQRPIESLIKIDPTKDFFFDNMDDVQVELQVTVKDQEDAAGGRGKYGRRVHYQETNDSIGGGFSTAHQANYFTTSQGFDEDDRVDDREDDRDDGEAYQDYQSNPTYTGA